MCTVLHCGSTSPLSYRVTVGRVTFNLAAASSALLSARCRNTTRNRPSRRFNLVTVATHSSLRGRESVHTYTIGVSTCVRTQIYGSHVGGVGALTMVAKTWPRRPHSR